MTDKELEQMLQHTLTPEVEEQRLFAFKEKSKSSEMEDRKMKAGKIIKPVVAMAAYAALVVGISRIPDLRTVKSLIPGEGKDVVKNLDNAFTLSAKAAGQKKKLERNKAVVVSVEGTNSASSWEGEDHSHTTVYSIDAPFVCEGKNVDKITYRISKGAFQITAPKGESFLLDGKEAKISDEVDMAVLLPADGEAEAEIERGNETVTGKVFDLETKYYSSYTVSAENQLPDGCMINIFDNRKVSEKLYNKLWNFDKLEELKEGRDELFKDLTITCEVTYKDGSKEKADIEIGNEIMTTEEAKASSHVEARVNGNKEKVEFSDEKDNMKHVFTTYKMTD